MKTLKYLLFITAILLFSSCSKDDDNPDVDSAMILGEWNFEELKYSGSSTVKQGEQISVTNYTGEAQDLNARLIFEDETNFSTEGSYSIKLTTTVNGETFVEDYPYPDISGKGTYRIDGNKMYTTADGTAGSDLLDPMATAEGTIVEFTSNRLVFYIEEHVTSTIEGVEVEVRNEMTQIFSR